MGWLCGGSWLLEPWVAQESLQGGSLVRLHAQALPYEIRALWRQARPEPQLRPAYLLVRLERDVSAHHVEQQDP